MDPDYQNYMEEEGINDNDLEAFDEFTDYALGPLKIGTSAPTEVSQSQGTLPAPPAIPIATTEPTDAPVKQNRNKRKFANRSFLAGPNFWYRNVAVSAELRDIKIKGTVVQCPTKANNQTYRIKWQSHPQVTGAKVDIFSATSSFKDELFALLEEFKPSTTGAVSGGPKTPRRPKKQKTSSQATDLSTTPQRNRAALLTAPAYEAASPIHPINEEIRPPTTRGRAAENDDDSGVDDCSIDSDEGSDLDDDDQGDWEDVDREQLDYETAQINIDEEADQSGSNPVAKENDNQAQALDNIRFNFKKVEPDQVLSGSYHLQEPGCPSVRTSVPYKFDDPLECVQQCGGLSRTFIKRLMNSSNYYWVSDLSRHHKDGIFHGLKWVPINIEEMHHFLGILLTISINPKDSGGYAAYFREGNMTLEAGTGRSIEIPNSKGFAHDIMDIRRFRQIRAAFHPEQKQASPGDKCYQLRHALKTLNQASKKTFFPSGRLSFDEGGVGVRSRLCPCRQYNKDKPEKYRVDMFILAESKHPYNVLHVDVYQGKNARNIDIDERAHAHPTTRKAVVNACYKTNLDNDVDGDGMRLIAMDNRYMCPELAVFLRDTMSILSVGTCRSNRVGMPKELLDMKKNEAERGDVNITYDEDNDIVVLEWFDNKIVRACSSIPNAAMEEIKRRVGSELVDVKCPTLLRLYQLHMFGVDKGDQHRAHMAGFASKAHFKKWYKKVFLGILDIMMLNGYAAWHLAREKRPQLKNFKRHEFYQYVAAQLCSYKEAGADEGDSDNDLDDANPNSAIGNKRKAPPCKPFASSKKRCLVCTMDESQGGALTGLRKRVSYCSGCETYVHMDAPSHDGPTRKIHQLFPGMSCHDILKSEAGRQIWRKTASVPADKLGKKYSILSSHEYVKACHKYYGSKEKRKRRKKKQEGVENLASNDLSDGNTDNDNDGPSESAVGRIEEL